MELKNYTTVHRLKLGRDFCCHKLPEETVIKNHKNNIVGIAGQNFVELKIKGVFIIMECVDGDLIVREQNVSCFV